MTLFSARSVEVLSVRDNERFILRAPGPGLFIPCVAEGDVIVRGQRLGDLEVLGRRTALLAPDVTGMVTLDADHSGAPVDMLSARPVSHGDTLIILDAARITGGVIAAAKAPDATAAATGLVFRAPMSGRFYTRSAPDKPAFVEVGTQLSTGATVCLLEVMKTFNRVTYGGTGLPPSARVTAVLVADGADVTAGEPLLSLT